MTWVSRTPARRAVQLVAGLARALVALTVLLVVVVGLPYGLVHYIGWPLPDHIPSSVELQSAVAAPFSAPLLLNLFACVLWPLWARFTFDVFAAIPDSIRTAGRPRRHGSVRRAPLHAAAGVLIGAILFSLLNSRSSPPAWSANSAASDTASGDITVASALYRPTVDEETGGGHQAVITAAVHTHAVAGTGERDIETVRPPEHGVHDSLWRVAQRCLGDGERWPEIWKLNQGTTQNDGRVLTTPTLIRPGWLLRLPTVSAAMPPPPPGEDERPAAPVEPPERGDQTSPSTPAPAQTTSAAQPGTGITLSTGAFVGLGLAALITIAMITARLHRRRHYRPGTPEPDDPSGTPVVRALRIAHDSATLPDDDAVDQQQLPATTRPADLATRDRARTTAQAVLPPQKDTVLGVRDGHAVALDTAHERGLGLIGPGAYAAARALIVTQLAHAVENDLRALVVVPADAAQALFGADLPHRIPPRLRVVDNLPAALGTLEAELLTRVRAEEPESGLPAPLILVATPTSDTERRLQAVLDNGSGLGLTGVLLGQWRPGGTVRVRADGTIGATSPTVTDSLASARLFTLPEDDTAELLALLQASEPEPHQTVELPPDNGATASASGVASRLDGDAFEFTAAEADDELDVAVETGPPSVQGLVDTPAGGLSMPSAVEEDVLDPAEDTDALPAEDAALADERGTTISSPERPVGVVQISEPERATLHLQVVGRLHLTWHKPEPVELIDVLAPRQREILVYLALHRDGSRREALTAALWPDAPGDRPYNSFHATLSQLRRSLRKATGGDVANITANDDGHYGLDQSLLTVDLWQLQDALGERHRAPTSEAKAGALRRVAELYQGDLATSIATDWIDGPREALRRDVLDGLSALIRTVGDDLDQTLALLEQARGLDPYNEAIYRDLMRTQARLGRHDSVPRTLNLLTSSLAELDQRPTRDTVGLADFLRGPRSNQRTRAS